MTNLPPGFVLDEPQNVGLPPGFVLDGSAPPTRAASQPQPQPEQGGGFLRGVDNFVRGVADTATFGLADEIAAGLGAATGIGGTFGDYSGNLARQRAADAQGGNARLAGQIAGGIGSGVGMVRAGASLGANAINAGRGLVPTAVGGAVDGAIAGGLYGAGSGEGGAAARSEQAGSGALVGGIAGMAAPLAVAGASTALRPVAAPIMSRLRPDDYARRAFDAGLQRSGMTTDDILMSLQRAADDGQPQFMVADAMGNSGQRLASTVARTPNNARQQFIEALDARQAGQGRRIAGQLAEAFDAPDTAAQRAASLTASRNAAADAGYGAARDAAGAVDVSGAIKQIDDFARPGVNQIVNPLSGIADDSVEAAAMRIRDRLTDGRSQLTDFGSVLRVKQDLDDAIGAATRQGAGNRARILIGIRNEIDNALAGASAPYADARNAFRESSRAIDAIPEGARAAQRGRSEDTIAAFGRMTPEQQSAFRAGYADDLIGRTQGAAVGVNKARPLINDATAAEFPAFASPGRGDQLGRRIGREQTMFETRAAATGGSKTADNLADMADMTRYDPSVLNSLLRGRPLEALASAASRGLNEASGINSGVTERLARYLMLRDPEATRRLFEQQARQRAAETAGRATRQGLLGYGAGMAASGARN